MRKFNLPVYDNKLKNRVDFQKLLKDILTPLTSQFIDGDTRLNNNNYSSGIPDEITGIEGFSRILWGLSVDDSYDKNHVLWVKIRNGIINGTNPKSPYYFGKVWDYDQRIVEMAALAYAIINKPECIYEPLSKEQKENFISWLNQANYQKAHNCNWKFFRVMVNVAFYTLGIEYNIEQTNEYLDDLDTFYIGNGWYSDGVINETHIDYYVAFAFHFYGLVYAREMMEIDPVRSKRFIARATKFADTFVYWFSSRGDSVPYGRSLTYRFAQVSFWSMLVSMKIPTSFDLGTIKGIIFRHLRWWNDQHIYDASGFLSQGYAYENHNMAEQYAGPTSMYWALKAFAFLSIPKEDVFWETEEKAFPKLESKKLIEESNMLISRSKDSKHVLAYTPGYYHTNMHTHTESKYEKFVYSNYFGFSSPRGNKNLAHGSFDNTFVVSDDGSYYRHKEFVIDKELNKDYLRSTWKPFKDVTIKSTIIPFDVHHFRIHQIINQREIHYADCGFAYSNNEPHQIDKQGNQTCLYKETDYSLISNLSNNGEVIVVGGANNTNLIHSRTRIPTIIGKLNTGNHLLISFVSGDSKKYEALSPKAIVDYKKKVVSLYLNEKLIRSLDI